MNRMSYVIALGLVLALSASAWAVSSPVRIYVDAAPNAYGSPDYPAWRDAAYQAAAHDTFVNMASSVNAANVGTTNFEIQDEVVYSFGDLGSRLTFVYFIPGATVADLGDNDRFQIAMYNDWEGEPTMDCYNEWYGSTWLEPGKWEDYNDGEVCGVVGVAGVAWWGGYNTNTQAELDQNLADWGQADESYTFVGRLDSLEYSLTAYREGVVPEPATMIALGAALCGLGRYVRRRTNA